jgi:molybdopterin-guanine dinucleotide biosynthesis protein B
MRIIGLAGWSGAGKTTLLAAVLPLLRGRGLTVSTIKHAHHDFDLDRPGKDSWQHREAGAKEVLIASSRRYALMHELSGEAEPTLPDLLKLMTPVDLVVVEGFKAEPYAKIEVHRTTLGKPLLCRGDPAIRALAVDRRLDLPLAQVDIDDHAGVAALMLEAAMPLDQVEQAFAMRRQP